ncbi:N-formylglutamate amidohydrolase [Roseovarius autotrophicus]|uniref:N-formylglutamate amidohydrolase n=1 Tax=Roseovarius autotrophicus TaxID=2824121 RepID=UPI0019DB58BF|nr:N-formylglutamate amidohydrolase [Roseovarius autotrophicus]MBE0455021.1 N-formylglutamate amidohydrolase [Roseovarius sp.]
MAESVENAVEILNADGTGPVVLVCEHATNHIPAAYGGLGLDAAAQLSHAAWDPGAEPLARLLSMALDAPLVAGRISRLVYDCNRPPEAPSAMPEQSETVMVPGNRGLDAATRAERTRAVYDPFTAALSGVIAGRKSPVALVTVHSFTPTWFGTPRAVEIGILHDADARLADLMLAHAPALAHRRIERNAPYGPEDGVTHTLRAHGLAGGLPNVMLEVRQDLLTGEAAQEQMASEILALLRPALAALGLGEPQNA